MEYFFVSKEDLELENSKAYIKDEDNHHLTKVFRAKEKDIVEISDGEDNQYICEIETIDSKETTLKILEKSKIARESSVKVFLYQGIPKAQKMDMIIQKVTEVGVSTIYPLKMKRCVVNLKEKEDKKIDRWQKIAYEAAKQSKRGVIPKVEKSLTIKEAIKSMESNDLNIVFYEGQGVQKIKDILSEKQDIKSIGIFIGPEGGFDEEEITLLRDKNALLGSLGARILRTETAGIVGASLVLYELGQI